MKKIIALLLLSLPLAAFAEEDFGVIVPEWKDFTPKAFADVKQPKGLGKLNATTSYWYKRRVNFESELANCKSLTSNNERFSCYETLKKNQYSLNSEYNARLEAQANSGSSVPGMQIQTDNMMPIGGGYLEQMTKYMPNEFR